MEKKFEPTQEIHSTVMSLSDEQKNRLLQARSAEEVAALLHEAGVDVQLAERLWAELTHKREADSEELSLDELEAVSGGARNAATEGCAATVEAGSNCVFTDFCSIVFTSYDVAPVKGNCTQCGAAPVYNDVVRGDFFCSRCGCRMDRNGNPIQVAKQGEFPDFKF